MNRDLDVRASSRADAYLSLEEMVIRRVGVGFLSPWTVQQHESLVCPQNIDDDLGLDIWLLMHPDLRGVRRVKVVEEALLECFQENSPGRHIG